MDKRKIQLFHKPFPKSISGFVHNSNAFRDFVTFVTNMFYMVLPGHISVNENTWEFSYAYSYNFKIININYK